MKHLILELKKIGRLEAEKIARGSHAEGREGKEARVQQTGDSSHHQHPHLEVSCSFLTFPLPCISKLVHISLVSSVQETLGDRAIAFLPSRSFQTGNGDKDIKN